MPTGSSVNYVAGRDHRPLPTGVPVYRNAHTPRERKPSGLNWDALTPRCRGCEAKTGALNSEDLCRVCAPLTPVVAAPSHDPAAATTGPGFETFQRAPRQSHVDRSRIVELYQAGNSCRQVHQLTGYAQGTVAKVLAEEGVEIRGRIKIPTTEHPALVDRYNAGETVRQLAEAYDCGDVLIRRILKDAGVEVVRPPRPARRVMNREPGQPRRSSVDRDRIVELYTGGMTIPEIWSELGNSKGTIRTVLLERGVQLRDDRKTHSGGRNAKTDPDDLVADVRRLYVDEGKTIAAAAFELGTTSKVIGGVMRRNGIEARPDASQGGLPGADRAVGLKQRITDIGATSREIKAWALQQGLIPMAAVGLPSARIVEAYAEAHPDGPPKLQVDDGTQLLLVEINATVRQVRGWAISVGLVADDAGAPVTRSVVKAYIAFHKAMREVS